MRISIFGLGYVGVVTAVCLAKKGHSIIGVDISQTKIDLMNAGISPIVEDGIPELLAEGIEKQSIWATMDVQTAIRDTEISIICVGTPSKRNGSLSTMYLQNLCSQIGSCLREKQSGHILVFRSTMLPGTMRRTILPMLEAESGKKHGEGFDVVFNPEFLRESTAVYDFNNPPKTVIGADSDTVSSIVAQLYEGLPGPLIQTKIEVAEMVKYVDNNFHALKITFANEIGQICRELTLDSHEVMDIFLQDRKLNISAAYLKPGFAFGGSCLPKDLRAINYLAKTLDLETPLLSSLIPSNHAQIQAIIKRIEAMGKRKIGFAGFSFKEGTDDLRESPMVEVIETLIGKGFELALYDRNVLLARLTGANKDYIEHHIPHISRLMVNSLEELIEMSEVIVIGNKDPQFREILLRTRNDQTIMDMVRIGEQSHAVGQYQGIYW